MKCPACAHEFELNLLGEPERPKNAVQAFLATYVDAFRAVYKTNPVIGGRVAAAAKRIVEALGTERSKRFAYAYLAMKDPFFLTKQHDLFTLESNLNKVAVALETGKVTTRTEIQQIDRRQTTANAFAHLLEPPDGPEG